MRRLLVAGLVGRLASAKVAAAMMCSRKVALTLTMIVAAAAAATPGAAATAATATVSCRDLFDIHPIGTTAGTTVATHIRVRHVSCSKARAAIFRFESRQNHGGWFIVDGLQYACVQITHYDTEGPPSWKLTCHAGVRQVRWEADFGM